MKENKEDDLFHAPFPEANGNGIWSLYFKFPSWVDRQEITDAYNTLSLNGATVVNASHDPNAKPE